jgi:dTDP-glucose pyrophosphorylase
VIYWTIKYLQSLGLKRFVVGVARRGMFVEDFVDCTFGHDCDVSFVVPSMNRGVGRTLFELAEHERSRASLVVLGDTYFHFADPTLLSRNEAMVLVQPVDDPYRWCTVEIDAGGTISALHDKEAGLGGPMPALIGVYYFPDTRQLQEAARRADERAALRAGRTEMADILKDLASQRPLFAVAAGDWLDCGNADRRESSHRALLQKREFNEFSIDNIFGVVTKRSQHIEKLLDEINYLRLLPPELSVLFPRVVGYSTNYHDPWLAMEYYGYPSLAEVFVFENVDPAIWEQVFVHVREIVANGFMSKRYPLGDGALRDMYLTKTRERLESMDGPPELIDLIRRDGLVTINGRPMQNISALWDKLEIEVGHLADNVQGCIVHGDLCLSNILYDLRSRVCKLLDPRGSFGTSGIYGDPRYDVAKLYHSVYGLYDFITNDLFHVTVSGADVRLDIRCRPQHQQIRERFEKVFFPHFDRREILLITGLLFASMPALHYDAPARQLAMYARALELFDEVFSAETAKATPGASLSKSHTAAVNGAPISTPSPAAPA